MEIAPKSNLLFISLLCIAYSSCASTATIDNIDLDSIHFPRFKPVDEQIVLPGSVVGIPKLMDGCIYLVKGKERAVIIWPAFAELYVIGNELMILSKTGKNIDLSEHRTTVGKKTLFDGIWTEYPYKYNASTMLQTQNNKCESTGYVSARKWRRL